MAHVECVVELKAFVDERLFILGIALLANLLDGLEELGVVGDGEVDAGEEVAGD